MMGPSRADSGAGSLARPSSSGLAAELWKWPLGGDPTLYEE